MTNGSSSNDAFLQKLNQIIQSKMADSDFGVNELAHEMGMSRSNLHRRVSEITGNTVVALISEARLNKAVELLKEETYTVSEVAWKAGFGSATYFNKCFSDYFGFPPGEAVKRNVSVPQKVLNQNVKYKSFARFELKEILIGGIILVAILNVLLFVILVSPLNRKKEIQPKSIAVLPFKNLSDDTNNQYFADGMMEEILNHLNKIEELRVISRTSVEQFRGNTTTVHEIAKKLDVGYILEGSVLQYGGKVRIMVNLVDARLDQYILTKQYDTEISDIFQIQSDIAKQVSFALNVAISGKAIKQIEKIHTRNMEAYSYYLQGIYFLNRKNKQDIEKTIVNFEKAIDIDPNFAEAYSGLANAYFLFTQWRFYPRPDGYFKSKEYALKALELDNNLAEAHATMGAILAWVEWKWEEGKKECELAIELNPNSSTARQYFADILMVMRRPVEAREQIDIALKLNPVLPGIYLSSANFYFAEGKCEDGLKECQKIIELNPPNFYSVYYAYFELYRCLGNELKAVESLQKAFSLVPGDVKYISKVKEAYDQSGMTGLFKFWIDQELENYQLGKVGLSQKYAIIGENKKALEYLEVAFKMRNPGLPSINYDPRFDNVRHESRFQALLDSMGLAPYQAEMDKSQIAK